MLKYTILSLIGRCCIILILAVSVSGCATSSQFVAIEPAEGVTQGFIHIIPEKPVASLILFAGGDGWLKLNKLGGIGRENYSWIFVVRARHLFAAKGFQVAVIDAPSDKFGHIGISRSSKDHYTNVRAVANYLKEKANVPVWLVGTSHGSTSVAYIAINDPEPYEGAVLTSTCQDVSWMDLSLIKIPTLLVHHKNDGCRICKPLIAEEAYAKLTGAKSRELHWVEGGYSEANECGGKSYHGFLGAEYKAVNIITEFILSR